MILGTSRIAVGALMVPLILAALVVVGPPPRNVAVHFAVTSDARSRFERLRATVQSRLVARRRPKAGVSQVRLLITQVTSLLQAGAPPAAAWTRAAGVRVDTFGVPSVSALSTLIGAEPATAVVGATRLAMTVGAPLAPSLKAVCDALSASAEAEAERTAALAGPRTTARVLQCLPLAGFGLGWLLGANPLATATDGRWGTACVVVGLIAMAAGRLWINRLVQKVRRIGEEA